MRDYVGIATAYAEEAVADKKGRKFGKWVRLAAKRFLADLKRARRKRPPFVFDEWHACDPCDFIEKLPHVEGKWARPEIELHRSHVFFVVQLFGFRNLDGSRRFTSALFAVARKNAKSTLAAAILLYCQCCEEEEGAQIISAATTGSQARIIFNVAKRMTEKTPDLQEAFGLACWANSISRMETGASFKPINAKASTQDGLNPSHVGLDEIHAHKSADLLNVLTSAAGARSNPLWLYTTTEGYTNPGPWGEIRQFAKQVLQGILGESADHFLVVFFAVDDDDDEFDESAWPKANPLMDANPHLLKAIRKEAVEARQMPSKLAEFKIKRLNRPASSATGWVDLTKWQKCGGAVDLDWLAGQPCWGAFDLASTLDMTSWRLVWKVDDVYYTWGRRFVPEDAVRARTERGVVPYAGWVAAGLIEATEGEVTDYSVVEARIREDIARFGPLAIGYDRWNAAEIAQRLLADGHPLVEFNQTTKNYHPAMQELERAYIGKKIQHGNDPVLNWCASNLIALKDGNLNMKPDKKRSPDKIDDMASLLMAVGLAHAVESVEPGVDEYLENGFFGTVG
ncbi:terminase large subunit [Stenotrophomonas sp. GD03993]|uniref:terminase large subunit n=1 Tax=unclassified Stenotrophomonas TaxID=196198 RepID=UPI001312E8A6|nr:MULTISPECIES: terminase TerL endonuclease subunit [unclassified Stenotrophomonas]MDH0188182.1 terminase large subunit [Stenotrophomonas sp. GD04051]MDH0463847.1 terminase large subunit [Stenotrophomonas sp. GD03993]MDH0876684.1 terminase large subunit [Stenotrophomonas sp. GD03877]MDH2155624.1 terminase large subunit [Stenotrophomonas sp. GD03657]